MIGEALINKILKQFNIDEHYIKETIEQMTDNFETVAVNQYNTAIRIKAIMEKLGIDDPALNDCEKTLTIEGIKEK